MGAQSLPFSRERLLVLNEFTESRHRCSSTCGGHDILCVGIPFDQRPQNLRIKVVASEGLRICKESAYDVVIQSRGKPTFDRKVREVPKEVC